MRFATLEVKMTLVHILRKYNVNPSDKMLENPSLNFIEGFSVRRPKGGVSVIFKPRNEKI